MKSAVIRDSNRFHPLKFGLWLGIASIIMLFAALTSAYIVRQAQGNWNYFRLPWIFWFNSAIIILSSITVQQSVVAFRNLNEKKYKLMLSVTLVLGCIFLAGQYMGWKALAAQGIYIDGNPSGSFVYVISGVHAAHILVGLLIMLITFIGMLIKPFNPNKLLNVQLMATYWHFVDVLWIYLFIFFQINFF